MFRLLHVNLRRILLAPQVPRPAAPPRLPCVLQVAMAQKSITSFFSRSAPPRSELPSTPNKDVKLEREDSQFPIQNKKSKRLRIDSDSESNSPPSKRLSQSIDKATAREGIKEETAVKCEGTGEEKDTGKTSQNRPKENKKTEKQGKQTKKKKESPKTTRSATANKAAITAIKAKDSESVGSPSVEHVLKTSEKESSDEEISVKRSKTNGKKKAIQSSSEDSSEESEKIENESEGKAAKGETKSLNGSKENTKQKVESKGKSSKEEPKEKKVSGFKSFFSSKKTEGKEGEASEKSGALYNPAKAKYNPIEDAFWQRGEKVPYLALARTMEEIEAISARLKIVDILSNFFRSVIVLTPDDLLPSVYLCLNKLAPAYESVELGIAETTLMKAVAQATGRSVQQIRAECQACGDLGTVAEQARSNQRTMFQPAALTIRQVFEKLKEIAQMTGQASMGKKTDKIQAMMVACKLSEARYLIRSLQGKLRIGLAEQSVLQALAQACCLTSPSQPTSLSPERLKALVEEQALLLKTSYCECPNYDLMVPVLLQHGIPALPQHCRLTPGIPLKPMLAHPTKGVSEVLQRFENVQFTCEWKYDGERAQIHVPAQSVAGQLLPDLAAASIYSRNQENNTSKYPDILGRLAHTLGPKVTSCVLDCEAVAWDKDKASILPFQILSTRKRKDAVEADIKVAVCVFMFDLLYLNGESLVRRPFQERRQLLRDNFSSVPGEWQLATSRDCSQTEDIQEFLEESIRGNCEGLMVKTLSGKDATYEIAKRSRNWLKLKKDYLEGMGDTIDAVVIGGYLGRGKRAGLYGGFLLACHDRHSEDFQSLCKIGTGFSDEDLQTHSKSLEQHKLEGPKNYYRYDSSHEPDQWFSPVQVWEIKCADLSLSPVHRAALGIVDPEKGISLRFPRFIRIRDDKTAEEATSAQQIASMYSQQDQVKNQASSNKNLEEDFY